MSNAEGPKTFGEVLGARRREISVVREAAMSQLQANVEGQPSERDFILAISGVGGVGKTTLLAQFSDYLSAKGNVVLKIDADAENLFFCLDKLMLGIEQVDRRLCNEYAELRETINRGAAELEVDPRYRHEFARFIGQTVGRIATVASLHVPELAPISAAAPFDTVGGMFGEYVALVTERFKNRDERKVILDPLGSLSRAFVRAINGIADRETDRLVVIMIDGYERQSAFLESWLLQILRQDHGDLPLSILIVVAGQSEIDGNRWEPFSAVLRKISLEPFTYEETRKCLEAGGIVAEDEVREVFRSTSGLPLLVGMISSSGASGDLGGLQHDTAIERFLGSISTQSERRFVVACSTARVLNEDIAGVIARSSGDPDTTFEQIKNLPFVRTSSQGWVYHDLVREQLLAYQQRESPERWIGIHQELSRYFEDRAQALDLDHNAQYRDETWRRLEAETVFHFLLARPGTPDVDLVNDFLHAAIHDFAFGHSWILAASSAAQIGRLGSLEAACGRCSALVESLLLPPDREPNHEAIDAAAASLLAMYELRPQNEAFVRDVRATALLNLDKHHDASTELLRAIDLAPENVVPLIHLGQVHLNSNQLKLAIDDFSRALALVPGNGRVLAFRGLCYALNGEHENARADAEASRRADAESPDAIYYRAVISDRIGEADQAERDYGLASRSSSSATRHRAFRMLGEKAASKQKYKDAFDKFVSALRDSPNCDHCWDQIILYGRKAFDAQEFEQRLRAIALPMVPSVIVARASALDEAGLSSAALQALESPSLTNADCANLAGLIHARAGNWRLAVEAYRHALRLDERHIPASYNHAVACVLGGQGFDATGALSHVRALLDESEGEDRDVIAYACVGLCVVTGDIEGAEAFANGIEDFVWAHHTAERDPAFRSLNPDSLFGGGGNA